MTRYITRIAFALVAIAVFSSIGLATPLLTQSNSTTPTFTPDHTFTWNSTMQSCGSPFGNGTAVSHDCHIASATFSINPGTGITVNGQDMFNNIYSSTNAFYGVAGINSSEILLHFDTNARLDLMFNGPVGAAGLVIDTDTGGKPVTIVGLAQNGSVLASYTFNTPGSANFPYFIGLTDSQNEMWGISLRSGSLSGFYADSLVVQNAQMAETPEVATMLSIGSGLVGIAVLRRKRGTKKGGMNVALAS